MKCPYQIRPHHVGLFTGDIDRAAAWWEEMLGAQKMYETDILLPDFGEARIAWLKLGPVYLEVFGLPGVRGDNARYWQTSGAKHVGLCVAEADFDGMVAWLQSKGVEITLRVAHPGEKTGKPGVSRTVFFNDPDGNRVELMEDYTPGEY